MASKHFIELMERLKETHIKKNADYANEANPFANFERAAQLVEWFSNPIDQVFAGIIGIKMARLAELEQPGRVPNNESIDDTYLDATAYFGLWAAYKLSKRVKENPYIPKEYKDRLEKLAEQKEALNKEAEDRTTALFKEICTNCSKGNATTQVIHAMQVHSASLVKNNQSLRYPTGEFFLLTSVTLSDVRDYMARSNA